MAELYVPSSGVSCTLPSLPEYRDDHTVSEGGLICGGVGGMYTDTEDSCIQWSPDSGTWEVALNLDVKRYSHVSWTLRNGTTSTYLMGGGYSWRTTTLMKNGSQEPGFQLKYDT